MTYRRPDEELFTISYCKSWLEKIKDQLPEGVYDRCKNGKWGCNGHVTSVLSNCGKSRVTFNKWKDRESWYCFDKNNELKQTNTKELLNWLKGTYACGGKYSPYSNMGPFFTTEEIKEELARREHIPNKQEAKALRQTAAKHKKKSNP